MKKLILLFLGLLFIAACSNDSEPVNFNENGIDSRTGFKAKDGNDLETFYNAMIASQEYIDFNSGVEIFMDKMNYTGDGSDLAHESKILNWISANISQTDFGSYSNAVGELGDISDNSILVLQNHEGFFRALYDSELGTFYNIIKKPEDPNTDLSCTGACTKSFNSCMDDADKLYAKSLKEGINWTATDPGSYVTLIPANLQRDYAKMACGASRALCVYSCYVTYPH